MELIKKLLLICVSIIVIATTFNWGYSWHKYAAEETKRHLQEQRNIEQKEKSLDNSDSIEVYIP